MNVWLLAVRPKTLVAGIAPVAIGTALAWADGVVAWWCVPLLVICSALIQIASNFINDLEDFKRGADEHRVGPLRAVAAGLVTPQSMKRASLLVVAIAFVLGLPLAARAGWEVLAIGCLSLVMSWAYTGGPFPLAYKGLGDIFAFVFFGVIAVTGTYYVHAMHWSMDALVMSVMPGAMAANILGVNNLRDIPTDALVGKRTLAVRMGGGGARCMYAVLMLAAIAVPPLYMAQNRGPWMCLPLVALPIGVLLVTLVFRREGKALNMVLGATAALYMVLTILTVAAFILAAGHSRG